MAQRVTNRFVPGGTALRLFCFSAALALGGCRATVTNRAEREPAAPVVAAPSGVPALIAAPVVAPLITVASSDAGGALFELRRRGMSAFFAPSKVALALRGEVREATGGAGSGTGVLAGANSVASPGLAPRAGWGLHWGIHGARTVAPRGGERLAAKVSFRHGRDRSRWRDDAPTFASVRYEQILAGVDLVIESKPRGIAYSLHAESGAIQGGVTFEYAGASGLRITDAGRGLEVNTGVGLLKESGLRAFQPDGEGGERELPARYVLIPGQPSAYRIEVDAVDPSRPLVIDPLLATWGGYVGGSFADEARAIAIDNSSNIYITGFTNSFDFPAVGADDDVIDGQDAFVTKLDGALSTVIWSTFLGGSNYEVGIGIAVDGPGNVYVVGTTGSDDFPAFGGFDTVANGLTDGFVAHFDRRGAMVWSSFLGGSGADGALGVGVGGGALYVVGETSSDDFPSFGSFASTHADVSYTDGFVTKIDINTATVNIEWSTYLGGALADAATAVVVNNIGDGFVAGYTASADFSANVGDTLFEIQEGFVTKLYAGGTRAWSTFVGGNGTDEVLAIALDATGYILLTGVTGSTDMGTAGAYAAFRGGANDVLVAKLAADGSSLIWSTYLGASATEVGYGIAAVGGDVVVTGYTQSIGFPTLDPFDGNFDGSQEAFVSKLSGDGSTLRWSSTFGGNDVEIAHGIAVSNTDVVYFTGVTYSTDVMFDGSTVIPQPGAPSAFVVGVVEVTNNPKITNVWAEPPGVEPLGTGVSTIVCSFFDGDMSVATTFLVTIEVRQPDDTTILLCDDVADGASCAQGGSTLKVALRPAGHYEAEVKWDPASSLPSGPYDLSCTVTDQGGLTDTSGFSRNQDELWLGCGPGQPCELRFATGLFAEQAGQCSRAVEIGLVDILGVPVMVAFSEQVNLLSDSPTLEFFDTTFCSVALTSVTLGVGNATSTFYFKEDTAGRPIVTATLVGAGPQLLSAQQIQTIYAGPPQSLRFTSSVQPETVGICSGQLTFELADQWGNLALAQNSLVITVTGRASVIFSSDSGCSMPITGVDLAPGSSGGSFYFIDSLAGASTLTIEATPMPPDSQDYSISPAPPTRLGFVSSPLTIVAGICSGPVTFETQDALGDLSPVLSATTVNIASTGTTGFYTGAGCGTPNSVIILNVGDSGGSFWVSDNTAGIVDITVIAMSAQPLAGDTQSLTVDPAAPAQLVFTSGPTLVVAGDCSTPSYFEIRDFYGNPSVVSSDTLVDLSSNSLSMQFFDDGVCGSPTNQAIVAAGTYTDSYTFTDTTAGTPTITLSAPGLSDASQQQQIDAGPPAALVITTPSQFVLVLTCSAPVDVEIQDVGGNPTSFASPTTLTLSTASPSITFFDSPGCTNPIAGLGVGPGMTTVSFELIGSVVEVSTVRVSESTLPDVTQIVSIVAALNNAPVIDDLVVNPDVIDPSTDEATTISCSFSDADAPPVGSFAVTLGVREPDDATAYLLCDNRIDGDTCGGTGTILSISGTNPYLAEVDWDPSAGMPLGLYDLECSVADQYGNGALATSGFADNLDELNLGIVCVQTGPDDNCDGIDDDCDGVPDDDFDATVCTATTCGIPYCNPAIGGCDTTRITDCCVDDGDCVAPTSCYTARCDTALNTCIYDSLAGCCQSDIDCEDGNPCTTTGCDRTDQSCSRESIERCCVTNADCDDGNFCTVDQCAAVARCQYRPGTCGSDGPCGTNTACTFASLFVERGPVSPEDVVVDGTSAAPILQLQLTTEAFGGTLTDLRFAIISSPDSSGLRRGVTLALYDDSDGDGALDADQKPLATADSVDWESGSATLIDIGYPLDPASTRTLLVAVVPSMSAGSAPPVAGQLWPLLPLLGLIFVVGRLDAARRRRLRVALFVASAIAVASCFYSPVILHIWEGTVSLADDASVGVTTGDRASFFWVHGAPVESDPLVIIDR